MSNPDGTFPDPIDFAALGRLDAIAKQSPSTISIMEWYAACSAILESHAAYRHVVRVAQDYVDVSQSNMQQVRGEVFRELVKALARFRNVGGAS